MRIETLKKNYEFRTVLNRGQAYYGKYITGFILYNKKNENLLGIAINSKLCNAVKRNKIKRLIRENYRYIDIKQGYSMVITINKNSNIEEITYNTVKKDMINIFKKAKLLT